MGELIFVCHSFLVHFEFVFVRCLVVWWFGEGSNKYDLVEKKLDDLSQKLQSIIVWE